MSTSAESTEAIPEVSASLRPRQIARALLFLWTIVVACPIRYWPIENALDNTWAFAMNYGAAHGLKIGRDLIWTTGPLGYLVFPNDIGNNLSQALGFQWVLWAILISVFFDLYYRSGVPVSNLAFFSVYFSLSAPLYWFNLMGPENLLLAAVLILLVAERRCGGRARYVAALVLAGLIPLIKTTGGILAAAAIVGYLAERAVRTRKIAAEAALAVGIPAAVAILGCWIFIPADAFAGYLKGTLEITNGYSSAMSFQGDAIELAAAVEVLIGIGAYLFIGAKPCRALVWFLVAVLTIPLLLSVKHGFVRQDVHVLNFFCFAALTLALISILLPVTGKRGIVAQLVLLNFGLISFEYQIPRLGLDEAAADVSGVRAASMAWGALWLPETRAALRASGERNYSPEERLEPALRTILADRPVAFLSYGYGGAFHEGLNVQLYPVVQKYAAFTPYLDDLNARWIREKGPRFLLFDGQTIDGRHPWAETPAMWLEVYRWYDTRLLGKRNLLLERRSAPRFHELKPVGHFERPFAGVLEMPATESVVFWTMQCPQSASGALRKSLFRIPEVRMDVDGAEGSRRSFRLLPEVLGSPVLGSALPGDLPQFASVLDANAAVKPLVRKLSFSGPGLSSYSSVCAVEFLTPAF
jgi:hypothetical protein